MLGILDESATNPDAVHHVTAADPKTSGEAAGLLGPRYRPVTISLMSSITLVAYNNLAVTAALPDIGDDLGSVGLLPWVVTVELLAMAIAVLAIGPLVDSLGVRAVYRVALVGFVATSILCAIAPSMEILIVGRVTQGLAAGGVIGATLSSVGLTFDAAVRPRMYAAISAVWGVLGVAGPALAAVLISLLGWRWIFLVIVPIGVLAIVIGWHRLPEARGGDEEAGSRFDTVGLAIVAALTVCLLIGASTPSLLALAWLAAGVGLLVVYVGHSRRVADPVVRLGHLTGARWRNLHITSSLAVAGGTGAGAFLPVYLRGARGFSTGAAAFSVLFMVVGWSSAAWVASRMLDRHDEPYVITRGSLLLTAGSAGAAVMAGIELPAAFLLACFLLLGAGIGLITTAGLALLQGRATVAEMGRISSAHQFLRSLGFAYGAAVAGVVLFSVIGLQIDDVEAIRDLLGDSADGAGLSTEARAALQTGYVASLSVMALVAAGTMASALLLRREGAATGPEPLASPVVPPGIEQADDEGA